MHVSTFFTGPHLNDLAALLLRLIIGIFFLLARISWLYDPSSKPRLLPQKRHEKLRERLCTCGYVDHPCMCACVALIEIFGGAAIAIGLFTQLALMGLAAVMIFAIPCKSTEDILSGQGEGNTGYFSWFMWNIEGAYLTIIIVLLLLGPGYFSLDYLLGIAQ